MKSSRTPTRYRIETVVGFLTSALLAIAIATPSSADEIGVQVGAQQKVGEFRYGYATGYKYKYALRELYPYDLDNDGRDELIFAGQEYDYPYKPETFDGTRIVIFGWQNDRFVDLTSKWLPGVDQIFATNDIAFGDFNGDGLTDFFTSANTDNKKVLSTAYEFTNKGGYFTRRALDYTCGQHGVGAGDLNGDTYDDVVPVQGCGASYYIGSSAGLKKYKPLTEMPGHYVSEWHLGGSDITAGKFLKGSTDEFIVVDNYPEVGTILLQAISNSSGQIGFDLVSNLPKPPLRLGDNPYGSHDIRAVTFDFNSDTVDDVVVFSRAQALRGPYPEISTIQFLKNKGNGEFEDVTATTLKGYETKSTQSYTPVLRDFDMNGRPDIFLSQMDFDDTINSTALLMQQSDGTFVETSRNELSALMKRQEAKATIIRNGGDFYLVREVEVWFGRSTVYLYPISFPGREKSEKLIGTDLVDKIWGMGGDDDISAKLGADYLYPGLGADLVDVGIDADADVVAYRTTDDSSGVLTDTVLNFVSQQDKIDLSKIDANAKKPGVQKFGFSGTTAKPNSAWYLVGNGGLTVMADVNGDTKAELSISIKDVSDLSAMDFVL